MCYRVSVWARKPLTHWRNQAITQSFLLLLEMSLVYRAERADPVGGQVFELGTRGYAVVRVALCGVILIPADVANILFHIILFLEVKFRLQRYDYFLIWQNYFYQ